MNMVSHKDLHHVFSTIVPFYFIMFMGYAAVRWWRLFTGDQCYGINRFATAFAFPFLTLKYVSAVDPGRIDVLFLLADVLSKLLFLLVLLFWAALSPWGSFDWAITLFSVAALPNVLGMGIPLIASMYGDEHQVPMVELVVMQVMVWNTLLFFLYEIRAARSGAAKAPVIGGGGCGGGDGVIDLVVVEDVERLDPPCSEGNFEQVEDTKTEIGKESKEEKLSMSWNTIILIMVTVLHKILRAPNFYAALLGLVWVLISSRWGIKEAVIIQNSISFMADAASAIEAFTLGMFMALQPRIIASEVKIVIFTIFVRFVVGPSVVALVALLIGIKGKLLKITIVQAAVSQGYMHFVYAREYGLHPEVLTMLASFGMILAFPITLFYYFILDFLIK